MESSGVPGSFRDPSGFMFRRDGALYRQVNESYRVEYDLFMSSGLYDDLAASGLLVTHKEVPMEMAAGPMAYKILQPETIPFISYPYEWCFGQLKTAALTTLAIARRALKFGLSLKDASAFNIQFKGPQPTLIDTLSFEPYVPESPWIAYRQFCQHFLAPLALISRVDFRMGGLLRTQLDGIPLDLAVNALPSRTYLHPALLFHLYFHAKSQARYADAPQAARSVTPRFSRRAFEGLLSSLEAAVSGLSWKPKGSTWAGYYSNTNYSGETMRQKAVQVAEYIQRLEPKTVWDLGANTGYFSRLASDHGIPTVAFDMDAAAVELNYRRTIDKKESTLLPLIMDLTNPTPALGWRHTERMSLVERGPADLVLALALIHHLAIGNNTPLENAAACLADLGHNLVIEFVPKSDAQVQRMLSSRKDIFDGYTRENFVSAFRRYYAIEHIAPLAGSERVLYLMKRIRHDG